MWLCSTSRRSFALFLAVACGAAAEVLPTDYWKDTAGFFERQVQVSLTTVSEMLAKYPPSTGVSPERLTALTMLDQVLHDESAARRPTVQHFFHAQIRVALDEMKTTRVKRGAVIWKLYDHAFVLRTSTVTLAFDLTRAGSAGVEAFTIAPEMMRELVGQCDILLVSHLHKDHADEDVARRFLEQGKPVVAPPGVWADQAFYEKVTHLRREPGVIQSLPVQQGRANLKVVVFPGHQRIVENNVVLVTTPEGLSICHTGDQNETRDYSWIDQLGASREIDVLMPNCWSPDLARMIRGAKPHLVVPGHENELGHELLHREPYWLTVDRLAAAAPVNAVIMTWGEQFHYEPPRHTP